MSDQPQRLCREAEALLHASATKEPSTVTASGETGAPLDPAATGRSRSPDSLGGPQLSQVALDNLTPIVHVDQPRDGVQQRAPLHVRQGTVSGVGQQQIQVVSCRVRQLPLVS